MLTGNPIYDLLHSRRFLLLMLDVIISTITFISGLYMDAKGQDLVRFMIGTYQPVFVFLIAFLTAQDVQKAQIDHQKDMAARKDQG